MRPWAPCLRLLLLLQLAGCVSQIPTPEQFTVRAIGTPVDLLIEAAMRPESYPYGPKHRPLYPAHLLPNGHSLYVLPDSPWCTKHVEADGEGIITDIRWLGSCR